MDHARRYGGPYLDGLWAQPKMNLRGLKAANEERLNEKGSGNRSGCIGLDQI